MAEQMGLEAVLSVYDNGFSRGLKSAERGIASFERKSEQMAKGVQSAYTGAVTGIVASVGAMTTTAGAAFGAFAVSSAADAQVIEAQYAQAFKGVEKEAERVITSMSKQFNILPERLLEPMSSLQSYFKGTGMEAEDALKTTENAMNVAADAAAYYDRSLEDVYGSLKGFLMGNYENGDAIGINTNLTKIATAYNEDYGASFKELSDAAQSDYLLEYIENIYKASGVTGQATRESEEWGNVLGNLQKSMEIFATTAGTPFLEPLIGGMQELTAMTLEASDSLGVFMEELMGIEGIEGKAQHIWDLIEPIHALMAVGGAGVGLASMLPVLSQLGGGVDVLGKSFDLFGSNSTKGIGGAIKKLGELKGKMNFSGIDMPDLFDESAVPDINPAGNIIEALKSIDGIDEVYSKRLADSFGDDGSFFDKLGEYMNSPDADKINVPDKLLQSVMDGQGALEGMIGSMDELGAVSNTNLGGMLDMFTSIGSKGGALTSVIGALGSAAIPVVSVIGNALMGVVDVIIAGIKALLKASMAAFNIAAIGGVVLAGMGYFYQTFQSDIDAFIDKVIDKGPGMVNGLANGIIESLPGLIDAGAELFARLMEVFNEMAPVIGEAGLNILSTLVQGIINNMDIISEGFAQVFSFILVAISEYLPTMILMGAEVLLSFVNGLIDNKDLIYESFGTLINGLTGLAEEGLPLLFEIGRSIINFLVGGLKENSGALMNMAFVTIFTFIEELFKFLPDLKDAGMELLEGIMNGFAKDENLIEEKVNGLVNVMSKWLINKLPDLATRGGELMLWIIRGMEPQIALVSEMAAQLVGSLLIGLAKFVIFGLDDFFSIGLQIAGGILEGISQGFSNGLVKIVNSGLEWLDNNTEAEVSYAKEYNPDHSERIKNISDIIAGVETDDRDSFSKGNNINPWMPASQSANINMSMGGATYSGFTDDIYSNNERQLELYENY